MGGISWGEIKEIGCTMKENMHRAWRCHVFGDYHDLKLESVPQPLPGPGQVLVRVRALAPGFPDMLMVQGLYQLKPALPFTPCAEFAGEVVALGAEANSFAVGDAVLGSVRFGAAAEYVVADASACQALPTEYDWGLGAAFTVAFKTAYVGLVTRGHLQPNETLLVHGASGGVGLAAAQLGANLGARVIATASGAAKVNALHELGAAEVIDLTRGGFREEVKSLTGGRGVDVVFDPVGGDVFDESLRCVAPFARVLLIGFAGGRIPELKVNMALIKQLSIIGVRAGEYGRLNPEGGAEVDRALRDLMLTGRVRPHVCARLPFENLPEAFDRIAARTVVGRLILER